MLRLRPTCFFLGLEHRTARLQLATAAARSAAARPADGGTLTAAAVAALRNPAGRLTYRLAYFIADAREKSRHDDRAPR